jgi:hypothetical protein
MDDLDDALTFIIKELKRQEFSELYKRAGSTSGLACSLVRSLASFEDHEVSVPQLAETLDMDERSVSAILGDLINKEVVIRVRRNVFKLRDPLFKVYLRWVLNQDKYRSSKYHSQPITRSGHKRR